MMYLHQVLKQPDHDPFPKAMDEEIKAHTKGQHWEIVHQSKVSATSPILQTVWPVKRKRRIPKREVYKWKARLAVDESQQKHGINYWETYAPMVSWPSICFFLIMALLKQWHICQLDFILADTQAEVEIDLYMEVLKGFNINGNQKNYALRLWKSLYGQKQEGLVQIQHLTQKLIAYGFNQNQVDECISYYKQSMFLVFTDDTILIGPATKALDDMVDLLASAFKISDEGELSDYLGIKIEWWDDGMLRLMQPQLIDSILANLHLTDTCKWLQLPYLITKILYWDSKRAPFNDHFDCKSIIGRLLYLEKSTWPELAYSVHQCVRFCANPKKSHGEAIKKISWYLLSTREKGMILWPTEEAFECWVDASHTGEWNCADAMLDMKTAKSWTGYIITYARYHMLQASKLQTKIVLSSTESEYITLSQALREVIPLMQLINEAKQHGINIQGNQAKVRCTIFEDNAGTTEFAWVPKMCPRMKHLNIKYHHFWEHVKWGTILIWLTTSEWQIMDIITEPLHLLLFNQHHKWIMGW